MSPVPYPWTPEENAILDSFQYHRPSPEDAARIESIREGYRHLAALVMRTVTRSADRTVALRKLHESMMTANKAIVVASPLAPPSAPEAQ